MATEIERVLASLPVGKRGPKTSRIRESLTQDLPADRCWPWLGRRGTNGYGIAVWPGERTRGTTAHRMIWTLFFGDVPEGMHIDHSCHDSAACTGGNQCAHRACVNPAHLRPLSPLDNTMRNDGPSSLNARKVECSRGHGFTPENTYTDPRGRRACRTCQRAHWRRYAAERKAG